MEPKVVVADQKAIDLDIEADVLEQVDAELLSVTTRSEQELGSALVDAHALIVDGYARVTGDVLRRAGDLRVVVRAGIGVDNIDVETATQEGIQVANVPGGSTETVATHAISLTFSCLRKITCYDEHVRVGGWDWEAEKPLQGFQGTTIGLLGFGNISKAVARKFSGFDVDVIACDPSSPASELAEFEVEKVDFDELLERTDVHSIHAPLTDETRSRYDVEAFDRMKSGAILINTARGKIIDEDALVDALDEGTVAMAGLDVMENEPPGDSPLLERDDVILTPHVAWYSEQSIENVRTTAASEVLRVLQGRDPRHPVNDPNPIVASTVSDVSSDEK